MCWQAVGWRWWWLGGGVDDGSLPGRQAFPACEATAAKRGVGGEEEVRRRREGGDKTQYEICGWGYDENKEGGGKEEKCQNGKLKGTKQAVRTEKNVQANVSLVI